MSGQSTERPRERTGGTDDGDVLDDRQAPTRPLAGAVTVPIAPDPIDASPGDLGMLQTEASEPRTRASGDAALSRGQQIGRYVVVDQLGAGGMGVVYRAFDPDLDRSVALKLVAVDSYDAADERSRLLREAQAMARLSHPNVIPVFDVGVEAKAVFVAMELVDGTTLTRWLAKTKPGWASIVAHFVEAGRGLSAAHAGGLIHRDFKPDNVMVGNDDRVRVLDFGLARGSAADAKIDDEDTAEFRSISASKLSGGSLDASMTADGTVMGTPAYMSPEQHMGIRVTAASDQFSFCVALWEALYGERPFAGDNLTVLTANVMQGKLRAVPAASEVPAWIHAAVVRGLSVDDDKRHSGMDALLQVLSHDPRARRRRIGVLAVGGASILAAGSVVGARVTEHKAAAAVAPALCTGSEDAVAETWNDARRDRLREAFDATGLAYAPAVWASAAARIDGYAAQWVEARTQACQATRVTGEQSEAQLDRRMLCLDRRRGALDDLLHALSEPDDAAVERTIDAVRRLPAVEQCADAERLHDPTPLPDDEAQRAAVEDAMAVLGRIGAQVAVGHYATAKPMLKEVLQTAAEVDHLPLTLEARSWEADIEAASGAPAAAREALLAAYAAATALDDVAKQARLAGELAFEFGYRAADRDRGAMWLRLGRALVRRGGADEDQAAQLDSAEGSILVAAGDYGGAVTAHERALAYWNARAPESASAARVLDDLGAAEVQLGKVDEAIARHEAALQIRRRVYGERHPVVAASERELGMALSKAGRDEQALVPITHALQIHREARGEHNTHVAACLDDLGRIERRRGNLDAALAHHQAALPIWEALLGEEHPDVAVSLLGIGYTLVAAERPADAVPIQRRALRMFETTVGETHPYIVYAGNALGMALLQAGDPAGAIEPLTKALALRGKIETDPTLFADTLFALGKASYRTASSAAERSAGRDRVQAARDLFATQGDRWTSELAKIDAWLAQPNAAVADATP